jgi:hypothetical protein
MAEIGSGNPSDPVFQQALGFKPVKPPKPKAKPKAKPKK